MNALIPLAALGVFAASTPAASQNPLEVLGTTLGLTALAGINLYLTVFVTGLAIHMGWLTGYPAALDVLGDPIVIGIAGVFYLLEFFADKVPWVDSLWDTVHTFVRPIGAAFIAIKALGTTDPLLDVVAGLLGGSVALCTHTTKAGTRLIVNQSPEPFSNVVLSVVEDASVLGGTWLVFTHPVLALVLVVAFLVAFVYFGPKLFRAVKAEFLWMGSLVRSWFGGKTDGLLQQPHEAVLDSIEARFAEQLYSLLGTQERATFAMPCVSGRMNKIGRFVRGAVVGTSDGKLWFLGRKNFRVRTKALRLDGARAEFRSRWFYDEILLRTDGEDGVVSLRFGKHRKMRTAELMKFLRGRATGSPTLENAAPVHFAGPAESLA